MVNKVAKIITLTLLLRRRTFIGYKMKKNFSVQVNFDGKQVLAVILSQVRPDGRYYEVNIKGYPRFYMRWSVLGRYDTVPQEELQLPDNLVLAVSDAIEEAERD